MVYVGGGLHWAHPFEDMVQFLDQDEVCSAINVSVKWVG
jgi:hypothetical protein